jgi:hypothetical protein
MVMTHHPVAWQAPRPLWRSRPAYRPAPQILRFASDDFMEELLAALDEDPASLSRRVARPETWRTPETQFQTPDLVARVPLPAPVAEAKRRRFLRAAPVPPPPAPPTPLKLYQPAHMRHYVVTGSLSCQLPGFPERVIAGGGEATGFVVRRILRPVGQSAAAPREHAYVKDAAGARWQPVAADKTLAPGEEMLPLFRLAHRDEKGLTRGLWAGVVPVGRREDYLGKEVVATPVASLASGQEAALRAAAPAPAKPGITARLTRFKMEVAEPWKALIRSAATLSAELNAAPPEGAPDLVGERATRALNANLQLQMQSWLILLDLHDWLKDCVPNVWNGVYGRPAALTGGEPRLLQRLQSVNATTLVSAMPGFPSMAGSLAAAILQAGSDPVRAMLEGQTDQYTAATVGTAGWPSFHFPLAGVVKSGSSYGAAGPFVAASAPVNPPQNMPVEVESAAIDQLQAAPPGVAEAEALDSFTAVAALALTVSVESDVQPLPFALKLRDAMKATAGDDGLFVIRFVHLNPDCGPLHPPTLSEPTEPFRMASFFDSDAPVRPIRISLPTDTSPAGLRKAGRGTAFVLSDMLCGQVQRAKGLGLIDLIRHVLPWPLHKELSLGNGGPCKKGSTEIGMICSLSIPIVTICALILLMIIVSLLDFIFRWLPWFIMCFPIPKLRGKAPPGVQT